ncbi:unnamed protein product [Allacma fusca]|uniref:Uncharacterized protein n=1 Tax=Allacma fusca TaxID=39272 RepID=A0A8J2LAG3_9HEXA|nr:unnamed protein product [Allacma fusca]
MTDSESLESLRARRKTLKTCLTKLGTKIESYPDDNPNLGLVEAHSVRLSEIWNDLTLNHYAILGNLKTQQEIEAQESDYGANESRVTDLRAKLFSVRRLTPRGSPSSRSTPPPEPKPTEVRL